MTATYVNPLAGAQVTPERIDMGVDYAGTGTLAAIGDGVVTQVNPGGWGKYGAYMEYKLTSGPYAGRYVYYAEGINPRVHVGQQITAGETLADLIPGWHSGIEIGWSSGKTNTSYAAGQGGGYKEGQLTAAGQSFSDFIHSLGAPAGLAEGRKAVGTAPSGTAGGSGALGTAAISIGGVASSITGAVGNALGGAASTAAGVAGDVGGAAASTVGDAVSSVLGGIFDSIVSQAKYAALALVMIVGGFMLMARGTRRATTSQET